MSRRTRREFVRDTAALGAVAATVTGLRVSAAESSVVFASNWDKTPDRIWIGPEYWANPLQDWRTRGGWVECIKAAPERHLHLLTHTIAAGEGDFATSVVISRPTGDFGGKPGRSRHSVTPTLSVSTITGRRESTPTS